MSALECYRRQAGSDRSPAAWICIRADLVPSSTLLSRPPPGPRRRPAAARTGEPTPSPCRPRSPTARARSPPASSPTPLEWRLPRTTAAKCRRPGQPGPGGPLALAPHPRPETGPSPHLDILTQAQRSALRNLTGATILDDDLPASRLPGKAAPTPICGTARLAAAKPELHETGLSYSINGPDEVHVGDDDKIQPPLQRRRPHRPRARRAPLRWTSPQHIRPEVPRPGRVPASEHPGGAR